MKAAVVEQIGEPLVIHSDWPEPECEATDAVLRVEANGICMTDYHVWNGGWPWVGIQTPVPIVLVHGFGADKEDLSLYSSGCGTGGPLDPDGRLPRLRPYGAAQMKNAAIIINVGVTLKMPPRAWVVAVATAMQESRLTNLGHLGDRNDHDSLGLFQQRPSQGWGQPSDLNDPVYASRAFFGGSVNPNPGSTRGLLDIPGWKSMTVTQAAQAVQYSAYPEAYAKWEPSAWIWLDEIG